MGLPLVLGELVGGVVVGGGGLDERLVGEDGAKSHRVGDPADAAFGFQWVAGDWRWFAVARLIRSSLSVVLDSLIVTSDLHK